MRHAVPWYDSNHLVSPVDWWNIHLGDAVCISGPDETASALILSPNAPLVDGLEFIQVIQKL